MNYEIAFYILLAWFITIAVNALVLIINDEDLEPLWCLLFFILAPLGSVWLFVVYTFRELPRYIRRKIKNKQKGETK